MHNSIMHFTSVNLIIKFNATEFSYSFFPFFNFLLQKKFILLIILKYKRSYL